MKLGNFCKVNGIINQLKSKTRIEEKSSPIMYLIEDSYLEYPKKTHNSTKLNIVWTNNLIKMGFGTNRIFKTCIYFYKDGQ